MVVTAQGVDVNLIEQSSIPCRLPTWGKKISLGGVSNRVYPRWTPEKCLNRVVKLIVDTVLNRV